MNTFKTFSICVGLHLKVSSLRNRTCRLSIIHQYETIRLILCADQLINNIFQHWVLTGTHSLFTFCSSALLYFPWWDWNCLWLPAEKKETRSVSTVGIRLLCLKWDGYIFFGPSFFSFLISSMGISNFVACAMLSILPVGPDNSFLGDAEQSLYLQKSSWCTISTQLHFSATPPSLCSIN